MFHDNDQYTLRKEIDRGGFTHYFISHIDAHGESYDTKVPRTTFAAYLRFEKDERNLRRWDERYREKSDLTEATLRRRALSVPRSVEDLVIAAEQSELLRKAIAQLPEIQRRRLLLHHEAGLICEEIGKREGCSGRAAQYSVSIAEEKIRGKFQNQEN